MTNDETERLATELDELAIHMTTLAWVLSDGRTEAAPLVRQAITRLREAQWMEEAIYAACQQHEADALTCDEESADYASGAFNAVEALRSKAGLPIRDATEPQA